MCVDALHKGDTEDNNNNNNNNLQIFYKIVPNKVVVPVQCAAAVRLSCTVNAIFT
jgi:hypothetical protein